jgi:hypothetical protein
VTSPIFAPKAQRELREAAEWIAEDNPQPLTLCSLLRCRPLADYKQGRDSGG